MQSINYKNHTILYKVEDMYPYWVTYHYKRHSITRVYSTLSAAKAGISAMIKKGVNLDIESLEYLSLKQL